MLSLPILGLCQNYLSWFSSSRRCGYGSKSWEKSERCANCKSDRTAYSHSCQIRIREKEILDVKITQKLSVPEASKLAESRTEFAGIS